MAGSRCCAAAVGLILVAAVAHAGPPAVVIQVWGDDSCPIDLPSHSALDATDGGLRLEFPFMSVPGVPGQPVTFTLMYSSAADNPGTYGTQFHVGVRTERTSYQPVSVTSAEVTFLDDLSGQPTSVGFGLRANDPAGNDMTCHGSRATADAVAFDLGHPRRKGPYGYQATWCGRINDHPEIKSDEETVITVPLRNGGQQVGFQRYASTGPGCNEGLTIDLLGGRIQPVEAGATILWEDDVLEDHGHGCRQYVYVPDHANEHIPRMGRNWTHSMAWHLQTQTVDNQLMVVLLAPSGATQMFRAPVSEPTPGTELPEYPARGTRCGCLGSRLFRTTRPAFQPTFSAPFEAFELVAKDGSRMVFTAEASENVPKGRLVRLEENYGRNPITLTYSAAGDLSSVIDAAGFTVNLGYTGIGDSTRLTTIDLPGGRVVSLGYTGGRLDTLRDPVQTAQPTLPAYTFQYGAGLEANDITCRTLPDGEIYRYKYIVPPPGTTLANAGRLLAAERVRTCADAVPESAWTYTYSEPDTVSTPPSPEDAFRSVTVTPPDPLTAPTLRYVLSSSGKLLSIHAICTNTPNCPIVPEINASSPAIDSSARVVEMVTTYGYDEFGARRSVRRYPVVQDPAGTIHSLEKLNYSATCVDRDPDHETTIETRGPTCIDAGIDRAEWTEAACDCELKQLGDSPPGLLTAVGPRFEWQHGLPVQGPTALPYATTDRITKAVMPGQRTDLGDHWPTPTDAGTRVYYYGASDPDGQPEGLVSYVCSPRNAAEPPAEGCEHYVYETATGPQGQPIVRLRALVDGAFATWEYAYNANHLASEVRAPVSNGQQFITTFDYGIDGLLKSVVAPGNLTTEYVRNPRGQVVLVTSPGATESDSLQTQYTYTPAGKLRRVVDLNRPSAAGGGTKVAWWMEYGGVTLASTVRLPKALRRGPAVPGDVQATMSPTATTWELLTQPYWTWGYNRNDAVQFWTSSPTAANRSVSLTFDGFAGLSRQLILNGNPPDSPGGETDLVAEAEQYCFLTDPRTGELVTSRQELIPSGVSDAACAFAGNNLVTEQQFDRAGRLTWSLASWDAGAAGEGSHSRCLRYDAWGRLSRESSAATSSSVGSCSSSQSFDYQTFDYDKADQPFLSRRYGNGLSVLEETVTFGFDWAGRFQNLNVDTGSSLITTMWFHRPDGLLDYIKREAPLGSCGGGFPEPPCPPWDHLSSQYLFTYDDRGVINAVQTSSLGMQPTFGDDGTYLYEHDRAGRLTHAELDPLFGPAVFKLKYTYEATNPWNLASVEDELTGVLRTYPTDDDDRIVQPGYEYNPHIGALKTEPPSAGGRRYRWDSAGRLLAVLQGSSGTAYSYDASDRLIAHAPVTETSPNGPLTIDAPPTIHLWNGWEQAGEVALGAESPTFSWMNGPQGVQGIREGSTRTRLFTDHQGSVKTDWSDNPVYEPFGAVARGSIDFEKAFQNQEWRAEASLYYMRHRWYDSSSGRFLSRDPLLASTVNSVAFVLGDPVDRWDPLGLRDASTPWSVGWEWLSGTGPRSHNFTAGDPFTAALQQHPHVMGIRDDLALQLSYGLDPTGSYPYSLGGLAGVPKYVRDASTLLTVSV